MKTLLQLIESNSIYAVAMYIFCWDSTDVSNIIVTLYHNVRKEIGFEKIFLF